MGSVAKNVGYEVARMQEIGPSLDVAAERTRLVVLGVIAKHTKTGNYARSVKVRRTYYTHRIPARAVYTTDPAALHLELGHWWVTPYGKRVKKVRPVRVFIKAYGIMARAGSRA